MKGRTHIKVTRERTVEHLDPTSATHAADQTASKKAREEIRAMQAERVDSRPLGQLRFESLAGGLMVDVKGTELTGPEHKKLLSDLVSERGWYWSEGERAGGGKRRRKRKTDALHSLAVLVRPDHALALEALDRSPKFRHLVRPFVLEILREVEVEFFAATGLEVVAFEVHPEEGVFHLHLTYASVSSENELLWAKNKTGRHGLRLLGPSHGGTLRLIAAGFLPGSEGGLARKDFADRVRALGGESPVDWRLAQVVEGLFEAFAERHGLRPVFADAAKRYKADLEARRAERPAALKAAKQKAEAERDALAREVEGLRAKLAAKPAVPSRPSSPARPAAAILPPLPPIFLSQPGRDVRSDR